MLTKKQIKLLDFESEIENDKKNLGFISRLMVISSIPHSRSNDTKVIRKNNNLTITLLGNPSFGGLPYGSYPRIILSYIITQVKKTKSKEIELGSNMSDFMRKLEIPVTGANIKRFKDQMLRLFSTVISISQEKTCKKRGTTEIININITIADKSLMNFNKSDDSFFGSIIILGESFYHEIMNLAIPINIKTMNVLKDSSLAIDIYFWLTYRFFYLKKEVEINFKQLFIQFGIGYKNTKHGRYEFRRQFLKQMNNVLSVYRSANVEISDKGINISPSKTDVATEFIRIL